MVCDHTRAMAPQFFALSRVPLAIAYFIAASIAVALTRYDGGIAFLWIATPLLIADLMTRPRRQWLASILLCAVASWLASSLFGMGWAVALPFAVINTLEAFLAAWVFRRYGHPLRPLGSPSWLFHFVISAGLVAPAVGAALAALTFWTIGYAPGPAFVNYFTGRALGNITITPMAMLIAQGGVQRIIRSARWGDMTRSALLLVLVAITSVVVFVLSSLPLLFLPVLPIILVTFRVGRGGAAIAIVLLALIGGAATTAGFGPIPPIVDSAGTQLHYFQFYLAATVLTVLPVAADLQQRGRLHGALRLSEERYRLMAEHSTDILLHLDLDGCIRYASPSIHQFGGHDPKALVGTNIAALVAPEDGQQSREAHMATIAARGKTCSYDTLALTATGEKRWFETRSRALLDEHGEVESLLSIVRDISERKAREVRLTADALTDTLTGLANRRGFRAAIDSSAADQRAPSASCIAVLDLDHFKSVNDKFGHDAGDQVLREFARIARAMVRGQDLVARIGGEEFAIFFPATSVTQALAVCERLRVSMSHTVVRYEKARIWVTVSGGVAPLGAGGIDEAFPLADAALYEAKRNGRDQLALAA
jgi:diguanylate cyclase (GGDEF)-like protein/PAS domain S-box-containing protein